MLKLSLTLAFGLSQLALMAQKTETRFDLHLQREKNGVTQIIDTSFSSEADRNEFLKTLEPLELKLDSFPRVKVYRFKEGENKIYLDGHLLRADSLVKRGFTGKSFSFRYSPDSLQQLLKFHFDSSFVAAHNFYFPALADSNFYRFNWVGGDSLLVMRTYKNAAKPFGGQLKKTMTIKKLEEAEKNLLPEEISSKLEVSNPPLVLEDLKVFPNPGDGLIQLSFRVSQPATLKIRVLNDTGQSIFAETVPAVSGLYLTEIDLRNAGRGTYFLYIIHGKKSAVRKLIVR